MVWYFDDNDDYHDDDDDDDDDVLYSMPCAKMRVTKNWKMYSWHFKIVSL